MKTVSTLNNHVPHVPSFFDDTLLRDFFTRLPLNEKTKVTLPPVNIRETNEEFFVEVAAPGVNKEDFKIEFDNNVLHLQMKKENKQEEAIQYHLMEFHYEAFQRSFHLPENKVDGEKIWAKYEHGILLIVLPKKEEMKMKPARIVNIS